MVFCVSRRLRSVRVCHGGCDGNVLALEVPVSIFAAHQQCQSVPSALDPCHHFVIGFVGHIHSVHFHQEVVVFHTCSASWPLALYLQRGVRSRILA